MGPHGDLTGLGRTQIYGSTRIDSELNYKYQHITGWIIAEYNRIADPLDKVLCYLSYQDLENRNFRFWKFRRNVPAMWLRDQNHKDIASVKSGSYLTSNGCEFTTFIEKGILYLKMTNSISKTSFIVAQLQGKYLRIAKGADPVLCCFILMYTRLEMDWKYFVLFYALVFLIVMFWITGIL